MLRVAAGLASRLAVALTAGRRQHQIMRGHLTPIRLMQVLADVCCVRMVAAVPLDSIRPVVGSPGHVAAGHSGTGAESSGTGEEVDDVHWSASSMV